jgi:hypothetical protein
VSATLERVYSTVDKSTWDAGAWMDEPDKVEWRDEATGLPCLAVRGPMGAWCGYVGVPPDHPDHGSDYDGVDAAISPTCAARSPSSPPSSPHAGNSGCCR